MIPIFRTNSGASSEGSPAVSFVKLSAGTSILKTIERPWAEGQQQHTVVHSVSSGLLGQQQQTISTPIDSSISLLSQHALSTSSPRAKLLRPPVVATSTSCYQAASDCQQLVAVATAAGTSPSSIIVGARDELEKDSQQQQQQQQLLNGLTLSQAMTIGISIDMGQSTTDNTGAIYLHT